MAASLIRERYEPIRTVGRGGQGEVLLALDHQHDRRVAIKVRPAASGFERDSILSEARILLNLRPHPGVSLVREDFFADGRYYLVMDWVEGPNLSDVLKQEGVPGLPFDRVKGWLSQAAKALDHLHAHDPPILHKDVKPANIVLDPQGNAVLVDFGVARGWGVQGSYRSGTPHYAAPELAAGEALTRAVDVFALAATAFELLTGGHPEPGATPDFSSVPRALRGRVRRALEAALAIEPSTRPSTASGFVTSLTGTPRRPTTKDRSDRIPVMIVDDHPMWRSALRKVIEGGRVGRVVAEASDGRTALSLVEEARPDVVVMDIALPEVDGLETTRLLRETWPDVKVLVLSSADTKRDVSRAEAAGASGYLVKTSGPKEITDAVRRIQAGESLFPPS